MKPGPSPHANTLKAWPWFGWFHPAWPAIVWLPVAIAGIVWGTAHHQPAGWQIIACAGAALFTWSFFEYLVHRFLLHPPVQMRRMDRFAYFAHGKHHDEPDHPAYALVPPLNATLILLPLLGVFYFVLPGLWLEIFTGFFLLGYLSYEYIHFAIHQSQPTNRLTQYLRRHHLTHHAHGSAGNFGVSTPLWDFVFRTALR